MSSLSTDPDDFVLRLTGVSLGYGDIDILRDISLCVRRGEVVALMGGSGSGKTTLLRAATGQIRARLGEVSLFNKDLAQINVTELQALRQKMGVLFQQGALFTDLNVFENVAFPLREHTRLAQPELLTRVLDALEAVGLRAAAHLRVSEISGGMARRVALARAVVLEPELVLYDEPFAGLDPISLGITARLIRSLSDRLGCASVVITHDINESFAIADHVYLIGQGVIKAHGTPDTLGNSTDPYVMQFLKGEPDGPVAFDYPTTPKFDAWLKQQEAKR
ncbi:ABC transporter ATP-binding protein [Zwartia vadi]|uniref:ABC transporter ATP-binding protein n=1 Tax=Zwartia vadi TaxID=3058168 RepID=UPI0025B52B21|nr:ABC transporter ATP-binding protein [Zwartia vadi]MDN3987774.1 ABC transporter ATP-binding protein [Zwartia vadi]